MLKIINQYWSLKIVGVWIQGQYEPERAERIALEDTATDRDFTRRLLLRLRQSLDCSSSMDGSTNTCDVIFGRFSVMRLCDSSMQMT